MNYKFAIVLEETKDYLRKCDLSHMCYLGQYDKIFKFDDNLIVYIEEDVNATKTERVMQTLLDNNIKTYRLDFVKWKKIPNKIN